MGKKGIQKLVVLKKSTRHLLIIYKKVEIFSRCCAHIKIMHKCISSVACIDSASAASTRLGFGQIELKMLSYAKLDELGACIF